MDIQIYSVRRLRLSNRFRKSTKSFTFPVSSTCPESIASKISRWPPTISLWVSESSTSVMSGLSGAPPHLTFLQGKPYSEMMTDLKLFEQFQVHDHLIEINEKMAF